jgi:hypothetical protein
MSGIAVAETSKGSAFVDIDAHELRALDEQRVGRGA